MLLDEFKIIFDRPEKVKKLREYILQLAVRGKLVEQDENDESASMLIDKIKKEKDILIKGKKIKKEKILLDISDEETPYKLPKGWEWQRLGNIINISSGKNLTKSKMNEEGNIPVYGGNGITGYHDDFNVDEETIVIGRVGFYCGSIHLTEERAWVTDNAFITKYPKECINREYLVWLLKGTNLKKEENATAQPVISGRKIYPIVIGIPPLNEQKRIVNKINYLMGFCDKLEKQLEKKVKYRFLSSKSVLNSINNSKSYEELQVQLRFVVDNFKELTLADEFVKELKNMIISLAVRGKLVDQDENDETSSELIKIIVDEKERLKKEKKIKREKVLGDIINADMPYTIPVNWQWIRLGDVTNYGRNESIKPENIDDDTWVLELEDIEKDTSKIIHKLYFKDRKSKSTKLVFKKNDVLYCKLRPYLNKVVVADDDGVCSSEIMPIRGYSSIYPKYLMYALKRPDFLEYVDRVTYGTKMPRLGTEDARNSLLPLPPFNEQARIANKLDVLMKICDELDYIVKKSKEYKEDLMGSVLRTDFR